MTATSGWRLGGVLGLVVLAAAPATAQQTITAREAAQIALEKNPLRRAALARERVASSEVRLASAALLPRVWFSETATRGNDPVYVFGTRLRQQRFTAADFALNRLNTPTPLGNFATRFSGQWNVFDSFANRANLTRAQQMRQAATHQLERSDQELVLRTADAYFGVLSARKQLELAEQAARTAEATAGQSQARVEAGVAVESDLLAARVNLASRRQELIAARNRLELARAQLATALGLPPATDLQPSDITETASPAQPLADLEAQALERRPDLRRLRSEEAAQDQGVRVARAAFGPRVSLFAANEWDQGTLFRGGGNNWTGGVELQLDLFQGGARRAQLQRERDLREQARALRESAENNARLELRRAWYEAETARQSVEVMRASITLAEESLRIIQNRYQAGLATITELLRGEDAARKARTDYWDSVYRLRMTGAALEFAAGSLTPDSPSLMP